MQTTTESTHPDNKRKCNNCKCWREISDFIGAKGNEVKRCTKCREKDAKQKQRPEVIEKRKALQNEKKYYQAYREKKREEDEQGYKKHCAEIMKTWRDNNKEHLTKWRQQNINYKFKGIKDQARIKGLNWHEDMTDDFAKGLMMEDCFYCRRNDTECVNGIDRMDNNKGYERNNCVSCCKYCNFVKKSLDAFTFIERCIHIASCHGQGDTFYEGAWQPHKRSTFTQYKDRAEKKGLKFDLDKITFENLVGGECFYCKRVNTPLHKNGVDRVDNTKGYIVDNCVACCSDCNTMKCDVNIDQFITTCKLVAANATNINVPDMPRCYQVIKQRGRN
jgi:hypothetical protein